MTEFVIRFEEDAYDVPGAEERKVFAEVLKDHPGQHALLGAMKNPGVARQYAYCIRKGKDNMTMFGPPGAYEAEARTMLGSTRIYVRYVGRKRRRNKK